MVDFQLILSTTYDRINLDSHWATHLNRLSSHTQQKRMAESPSTVFVTLSDAKYSQKAFQTIRELRERGRWLGPIVYLTVDFTPPEDLVAQWNVIVLPVQHIDTSRLVEQLTAFPIGPSDDGRHLGKLVQWDKLYAFSDYFRGWNRVIFCDAGLRIFDSVESLLSLPWKGRLLAPDDSDPYDNGNRFKCQLHLDKNPLVAEALLAEFGEGILTQKYFLNCIFMYDTDLLNQCGMDTLVEAMNKYPICHCNEMTIMNLLFTFKLGVWQPFPQRVGYKYLFGWCERNYKESPTWRDFSFIKYSVSG